MLGKLGFVTLRGGLSRHFLNLYKRHTHIQSRFCHYVPTRFPSALLRSRHLRLPCTFIGGALRAISGNIY
jgi:hypothetical protein